MGTSAIMVVAIFTFLAAIAVAAWDLSLVALMVRDVLMKRSRGLPRASRYLEPLGPWDISDPEGLK